ncbi:bifunctional acetate--CoA ligase family protein/GNAT family N-acetyltransferase [uncultured Ferrovibrio sp.]|jgi:Acyl-CoA synthetase (NDP forming)|uniref:bifunctional acetate--CoA ligase family protein/GNAT family N-acetyltransferase n=1 Tax=uncultured Ferrovibrio sp. TaxID=1576913 RepID=UPI002639C516|nr:bifunctional acetate--CoA ligase family protein/GNAT family N-acetyltransferase [uncultured Ferrovibrio sp.]
MTIRNLDKLFAPRSVAVIGASDRPTRVGTVVLSNILSGGFQGSIWPVNPKYRALQGLTCYPDVRALPASPDLAVICTPPDTVPGLIGTLGETGCRAVIVLTAGLSSGKTPDGRTLQQAMLDAAKPHLLRILGPNCVGMLVPGLRLNASFAHTSAEPGQLAFVSQSGALCTIVLDWAKQHGIGFSHFISLGDSADIDFGDMLDYLASDPQTRAILLYIESVKQARKFVSAARAAARNKPIVAVKSGRNARAAQAAASHTGALAGGDDVYSAALRRAGILRVDGVEELFAAVETLGRNRKLPGERLAIVTNGGGPGVMAVDKLIEFGGSLADLSPATITQLDAVLPPTWSHSNPIDIIGDAPSERYAAAVQAVLSDPGVDAVLVMHAPTAIVPSIEPARAVIKAVHNSPKNILTCWSGGDAVQKARKAFAEAGLASYDTPDAAIRAFAHMVNYRRNMQVLMQTPDEMPEDLQPDHAAVREVIETALRENRSMLNEIEGKRILSAYGIPAVPTEAAATPEEAATATHRLEFPVAIKILSPDITHKSDVGGVALNLSSEAEVLTAAQAMLERVRKHRPEARIDGFTVQPMIRRARAHELIIGALTDPIFGPAIMFGQGGVGVEVIGDRAVALPPLNMHLANDLIDRTKVSRLLSGYRDFPPVDRKALATVLIRVAQLIADHAEISELDINPLYADDQGMIALDARIVLKPSDVVGHDRLAIRPYPRGLEETITLPTGEIVLLRPIRPEDEPTHHEFVRRVSAEDFRLRFFSPMRALPHSEMARFTQIDYEREMAFIATRNINGHSETLGVVRAITDPDNIRAEFAVLVRSDMKGHGLGQALMRKIIQYCKQRGTREIIGDILRENQAMRTLATELGFQTVPGPSSDVIQVRLPLNG